MASTVITGHGYDKIFTSSGIYYIGRKTFLQNYLVTPVLFSTFASNTGSVVFLYYGFTVYFHWWLS